MRPPIILALLATALLTASGLALANRHAAVNRDREQSVARPPGIDLSKVVRPSASLDTVQASTLEHFTRANSVVLATAAGRHVSQLSDGNLYTFFRFTTKETLKGSVPTTFELRLFGGSAGGVTVTLPVSPEFQPGTDYILMLGPPNLDGYSTLNPAAIFTVQTSVQFNRQVVVPGLTGLTLYDRQTAAALPPMRDWAFLEDALFSLRRAGR